MRKLAVVISAALVFAGIGLPVRREIVARGRPDASANAFLSSQAPTSTDLDTLLAPVALYPDQLLAQMLLCATDPAGVKALDQFLKSHANLKGTELQDAALKDNFQPSFVALALFPQIVERMASQPDSTARLGQAFTADRTAVFASIQRLRSQARDAGNLKTTPQQEVETQTTSTGEQVIIIEPTNPQVVYVPQYNPQTVYVQPPTTVVVQNDNSADAAVAGMIGFTAGIAIGAAVNNNYYYGPYGWHGGGICTTTRGTTTPTTAKTRATIGRTTARISSRSEATALKISRSSAPSARETDRRTAPNRRRSGVPRRRRRRPAQGARAHMNPVATVQRRSGQRPRTGAGPAPTHSLVTRAGSRNARRVPADKAAEAAHVREAAEAGDAGDDQTGIEKPWRGPPSDVSGADVPGARGAFTYRGDTGLRPADICHAGRRRTAH